MSNCHKIAKPICKATFGNFLVYLEGTLYPTDIPYMKADGSYMWVGSYAYTFLALKGVGIRAPTPY
jgi:hypothetical protein